MGHRLEAGACYTNAREEYLESLPWVTRTGANTTWREISDPAIVRDILDQYPIRDPVQHWIFAASGT